MAILQTPGETAAIVAWKAGEITKEEAVQRARVARRGGYAGLAERREAEFRARQEAAKAREAVLEAARKAKNIREVQAEFLRRTTRAREELEKSLRTVTDVTQRKRVRDEYARTMATASISRTSQLQKIQKGIEPEPIIEPEPKVSVIERAKQITVEAYKAGLGIPISKVYKTLKKVGEIGPVSPYELETGKFVAGYAPAITLPAYTIPGTMFMAGKAKVVVEEKEKAERGARAMIRAIEKLMKEKKTKLEVERAIDKLLKKEVIKATAKGIKESTIKAQLKDILTFLQDRGLFTKVYEIGARAGIPLVAAAPFYAQLIPGAKEKEKLEIIPKVIEVPKEILKVKEKEKLEQVFVTTFVSGVTAPALKPPIQKEKISPVLKLKMPVPQKLAAPTIGVPRPAFKAPTKPELEFFKVPRLKRIEEKLKPAEVRALKKLAVGYKLWVKRKEKVKLFPGLFPKAEAIMKGIEITGKTLAVTFGLIPTKEVIAIKKELPPVIPSPLVYRPYKIEKGVKVPLKLTWIQRARFRLAAPGEVAEIIKARKTKRTKKGGRIRWL